MKRQLFFISILLLTSLFSLNTGESREISTADSMNYSESLIIVTAEQVRNEGYPINSFGETYGPDIYEDIDNKPDLMLAQNTEGKLGYIRADELNSNVQTIEQALAYNKLKPKEINLYLQDGRTCIGKFAIGD